MLVVTVESNQHKSDTRSLVRALSESDALRGSVSLSSKPQQGKLGATDTILIALTAGTAIPVTARSIASVMIEWLRRSRGDVKLKGKLPDGTSLEIEAHSIRKLSAADVMSISHDTARRITNSAQSDE